MRSSPIPACPLPICEFHVLGQALLDPETAQQHVSLLPVQIGLTFTEGF